mmetsp:Transcript_23808/g.36730  ORF Transcript_23808/g.36730 Transcript_23808/m.36730 type:complete len:296 (+) Transcript_23808:103-990(+)
MMGKLDRCLGIALVYMFLQVLLMLTSAYALTLSPAEKFLVGARLEKIQEETKEKARDTFSSFLSSGLRVSNSKDIVVIFPGAGGPDQFTSELCEAMKAGRNEIEISGDCHSCVEVFDWSEHRGSIATAAFDAEAVGESVADVIFNLNEVDSIRSIHSVGISVGGFAGNAFARRTKELGSKYVRLTLLDPFCSRGLLGVGYGAKNFGLGVDFAEHYMNTDDPVPTTNDPLPNCAVIDVTNCNERKKFALPEGETMHTWPLVYFARHVLHNQDVEGRIRLPLHSDDDMFGRGSILTR